MVATVQQLIGKVNPKLYAKNGDELLKKYKTPKNIPAEKIDPKSNGEYHLVYDSTSETLEPIYFFILDLMNDFGLNTIKLADNFSSSPGSGHFSEMGQKATLMQQQASKILADVGVVMRGVLNIIYDLKEFKIRLQHYDDYQSKNKDQKVSAHLALKQIWLDKVDILKGNSSIKAMTFGQTGFQPLLDAFLVVDDEKDVKKLDLNERLKRVLLPRVSEFRLWIKESEKELRKRYGLEKTYLKSQVNNLKIYSRWVKPYLKAAHDLERKEVSGEPALVKAFNTILLELTLLGKSEIKVEEAALAGDLPIDLQKLKVKRKYYKCVLIDFKFRGIPQKIPQSQHYAFGGRAEVTFASYALNEDELTKLKEELDSSEIDDVLALIEGSTTESLSHLEGEINEFLDEIKEDEKGNQDESNPFVALLGGYNKEEAKKEDKKSSSIKIRLDDYIEKEHLRAYAAAEAEAATFKLFDVYKKAHGMPSYT